MFKSIKSLFVFWRLKIKIFTHDTFYAVKYINLLHDIFDIICFARLQSTQILSDKFFAFDSLRFL